MHRAKQTLFLDARKLGTMIDRVHRQLTDEDIARLADAYRAWRGDNLPSPASGRGAGGEGGDRLPSPARGREAGGEGAKYKDVPGFCKSATLAEIAEHGHVLTPGRYVGAEEVEDDDEPFGEKMQRLLATLNGQFAESAELEKAIRQNLVGLGFGGNGE